MATNFYFQKITDLLPVDIEQTFKVRVTSVRGLHPANPKELFTRDWADENGIEVYLPETRKRQATEVVMTCFVETTTLKTAIELYDEFCEYVFDGEFDYWDNLQGKKVKLIYMTNKPAWYQFVDKQKLMFEITFLNYSGARTDVTVVVPFPPVVPEPEPEPETPPEIETIGVENIVYGAESCSVDFKANLVSLGTALPFTWWGIYWGQTVDANTNGVGNQNQTLGSKTMNIDYDLPPDTDIYYKAYATNAAGTVYGEILTFHTPAS